MVEKLEDSWEVLWESYFRGSGGIGWGACLLMSGDGLGMGGFER